MRIALLGSIPVMAIVLLAGCGAPAVEETAPAPPPPSPTATATPGTGSIVLTTRGLGALVLGEAPAEGDEVTYDPDFCLAVAESNGDTYPSDQDPGRWIATTMNSVDGFPAFGVQVIDGIVTRVDLHVPGIVTDAGIGVGSRVDEVIAAYPSAEIVEFPLSDVVVVEGEGGRLLVEVPRDRQAGYWPPEQLDTVIAINATVDSFDVFDVAGSDNRAGEC